MKKYVIKIIEDCLEKEMQVDQEWNRLLSNIQPLKVKKSKLNIILFQFGKYAAAIFLGVLITATFFNWAKESKNNDAVYEVITAKGERSHVKLPDGTSVRINSCSILKFAKSYALSNRNVYLEGEAYFEVAKNKDMPFIVKVNGADVKAIGTAFNVSAYKDDNELRITLFNGKVKVQPTLTKQEVLLKPEQVATYYKMNNNIEVKDYNSRIDAQWLNNYLSFERMYLQDITKILERNYNVCFHYENQKVKKLRFNGSFKTDADLSEILQIIQTNTGIKYEFKRDSIIIK